MEAASLNSRTILRELTPLLVLYPEAGHNGNTIPALAEQWRDLLADEDVAEAEFLWAVRRAKKKCRFFPKIADIMEGVTEYREHPPATVDAAHRLPQESIVPLSPEEIARNQARLAILTKQFTGKLTAQEALEQMRTLEGTK